MALTIARSDLYPVGTNVKAFALPKRMQGMGAYRPVGEPSGVAVFAEAAVVGATGELTFGGLIPEEPYILWANVGGQDRYLFARDSGFGEGMIRTAHTWSLPGLIAAETLPGPTIEPAVGEAQRLVRVDYRVREPAAGTVTFTIRRNGVAVPGMEGLVAGEAAAHATPAPVTLAAGDELTCQITAVANAPKGLSVTIALEHQPSD